MCVRAPCSAPRHAAGSRADLVISGEPREGRDAHPRDRRSITDLAGRPRARRSQGARGNGTASTSPTYPRRCVPPRTADRGHGRTPPRAAHRDPATPSFSCRSGIPVSKAHRAPRITFTRSAGLVERSSFSGPHRPMSPEPHHGPGASTQTERRQAPVRGHARFRSHSMCFAWYHGAPPVGSKGSIFAPPARLCSIFHNRVPAAASNGASVSRASSAW